MDKHFEDMMRKRVDIDRLKTEKEAIEFWYNKLIEVKKEKLLAALQTKINDIIQTMENRMRFLERERKKLES
jgi:hypothetical protein